MTTIKNAKLMTGDIYMFPINTVGEFKKKLSEHKNIPYEFIKILDNVIVLDNDYIMNEDITYYIFIEAKYILLPWIDESKLDWDFLSENPNAINLLEANMNKINWNNLSLNPKAIYILEENFESDGNMLNWCNLSYNINAINLLEKISSMKEVI